MLRYACAWRLGRPHAGNGQLPQTAIRVNAVILGIPLVRRRPRIVCQRTVVRVVDGRSRRLHVASLGNLERGARRLGFGATLVPSIVRLLLLRLPPRGIRRRPLGAFRAAVVGVEYFRRYQAVLFRLVAQLVDMPRVENAHLQNMRSKCEPIEIFVRTNVTE